MLALDLDPSRVHRVVAADSVAEVATQAGALAELVARCGGQVLADVSPSGGRHVFVLFAAALPWRELRDVTRGGAGIRAKGATERPDTVASVGGPALV